MTAPVDMAIISNEPTPYRLYVLRRLTRELPDVRVHNIFTHRLHDASMPWQLEVDNSLNPVFFEDVALAGRARNPRVANTLFKRIADYLVARQVRLVILLGYNDLTRLRLIRWARARHLPLLLHADSNVYSDALAGPLKRLVKRAMVRRIVAACAGLMPMGSCGRAYFRLYADHDKPVFINPYEPDYDALTACSEQERQAFMDAHDLDPARQRLLYCGRLAAVKRVDVLIDALAAIASQRPTWDLVIAGDGPMRDALVRRIPEHLRQRVRMLGFLQFQETRACYHCCDVLVHPSAYEPWGLVINEAVACGLPVVATDITGAAAELVRHGENGILVRPGDVTALAAALMRVTEADTRQAMRAAAGPILKAWRARADPVQAVREALRHWKLI